MTLVYAMLHISTLILFVLHLFVVIFHILTIVSLESIHIKSFSLHRDDAAARTIQRAYRKYRQRQPQDTEY